MSAKVLNSWAGFASIVWMFGGYAVLFLFVEPRGYHFSPDWLFMLTVLAGWLGVGLLLAIYGLRHGTLAGRVCAILGLGVFLYFSWMFWLGPAFTRPHRRAMRSNNALEPTPVGRFSSAFAVDITGPAWLSLGRQAALRAMSHVAQGVFRVVGQLVEGWLTVEYVRHCGELPAVTPAPGGRVISIRDDLWIDRVPVEMVAIEDRMPNTLLRVTVRERTEVIHVERDHAA